jgi:RNA polymerase sigma-70 factor (ECF subfamily)
MSNAAQPLSEALYQAVSAFRPFVAQRVPPHAADDILQEAFAIAHESASQLRDPSKLKPWVFSIIRNAISRHRALGQRASALTSALSREEPPEDPCDPRPQHLTPHEALAAWTLLAIRTLPSPYADALHMVDVEGLTQAQAAATAGISLSGMKSRVQRARALLKAAVLRCCALEIDARNRVFGCHPQPGSPPCACNDPSALGAGSR